MPCAYAGSRRSTASPSSSLRASSTRRTSPALGTRTRQSTRTWSPAGIVSPSKAACVGGPSPVAPRISSPSTVSAARATIASSVLLFRLPESVSSSPARKKRGACRRAIRGWRVRVFAVAMPKRAPSSTARTFVLQRVVESGYSKRSVACPFSSVTTSGVQKAVARKSLRTRTAGSACSPPAMLAHGVHGEPLGRGHGLVGRLPTAGRHRRRRLGHPQVARRVAGAPLLLLLVGRVALPQLAVAEPLRPELRALLVVLVAVVPPWWNEPKVATRNARFSP